jgi:rhodanese-related sulfurtransferase
MKKTILLTLAAVLVFSLGACSLVTKEQNDQAVVNAPAGAGMTNQPIMTDEKKAVNNYIDVSPLEAKNLIDTKKDLIVIDVSPNYANGHLPGAVSYYLGDGSLDRAIPSLDKNKPYLVYCHVDSVAISGAKKLIAAGFKEVYRLEGNYAAWVAAGYEIEK